MRSLDSEGDIGKNAGILSVRRGSMIILPLFLSVVDVEKMHWKKIPDRIVWLSHPTSSHAKMV